MRKFTPVLVTLTFVFACLCLWWMLTLLGKVAAESSTGLPGFTSCVLSLRIGFLVLPAVALGYLIFPLPRRRQNGEDGPTYFAWLACALCLAGFPALIALFLPCLNLLLSVK